MPRPGLLGRAKTTRRNVDPRPAVDLVERDFTAHGPDQLWGADITYKSFFATLEYKLLDQKRFKTQAEAKMAVFDFVEGFYSPRRRHSSLGQISPVNFERRHEAAA